MLSGEKLSYRYTPRASLVLDGVDIAVAPGEIVGLTGWSGRGKSTLGRLLAGHLSLSAGRITIDGQKPGSGFAPVQYLHQSPIFATDPRWRVGRIVEEAWQADDATREELGIETSWYDRYPHEISGGELQRIALLRILAPGLRYLVADEITAMLDPVAQVDIWQCLLARARKGLGVLAISHDQALLDRIATRIVTL